MNERERWIVYPLLFFALGASLRDKFLQHVSTKEVECTRLVADTIECKGGVICQGVVVLDPANPTERLVELGQAQPAGVAPGQPSQRFGVLVLRDNSGKILCGVLNNALYVRQVNCEGVRVVDPEDDTRTLAGLGSVAVAGKEGKPERFGVLALNNRDFGTLTGNPPRDVIKDPVKDKPAADPPAAEPADKPADDAPPADAAPANDAPAPAGPAAEPAPAAA
jgi:hypothetical protein